MDEVKTVDFSLDSFWKHMPISPAIKRRMRSRTVWATWQIPSQSAVPSKTLSKEEKEKKTTSGSWSLSLMPCKIAVWMQIPSSPKQSWWMLKQPPFIACVDQLWSKQCWSDIFVETFFSSLLWWIYYLDFFLTFQCCPSAYFSMSSFHLLYY